MTTKISVLALGYLPQYLLSQLNQSYEVSRLELEADLPVFIEKHGNAFPAVVTSTFTGICQNTIDLLPELEIISSFGVGTDSLDIIYANSKGIVVGNTPDVLNDDTANMAVALLLATTRNLVANDRFIRNGLWQYGNTVPLGRSIRDKTVGLIGMGRIGSVIAEKLTVFGCHIVYHSRTKKPDVRHPYYHDLLEMARTSDVLVVIVPGSPETSGLVSREILTALGPNGTLINVARGSVVDEAALVDLLASGRLGWAGIDVFADEPNVPETLFSLENVVLQPHMGSATSETRDAMADRVVANLQWHFGGKLIPKTVDPRTERNPI